MEDFNEGELWGVAIIDDDTGLPFLEMHGLTAGELQMAIDSWPDDELVKDRCSVCFGIEG